MTDTAIPCHRGLVQSSYQHILQFSYQCNRQKLPYSPVFNTVQQGQHSMQQPPNSSQGPMATVPYHKEHSWGSHAWPKAEVDEEVVEVCPGPPLCPIIPLHPVPLDVKGNLKAKDQQVVPWRLILVLSSPKPAKEAAAVKPDNRKCAQDNLKPPGEGRPSSGAIEGSTVHTDARLHSSSTVNRRLKRDPRINRAKHALPTKQQVQCSSESRGPPEQKRGEALSFGKRRRVATKCYYIE